MTSEKLPIFWDCVLMSPFSMCGAANLFCTPSGVFKIRFAPLPFFRRGPPNPPPPSGGRPLGIFPSTCPTGTYDHLFWGPIDHLFSIKPWKTGFGHFQGSQRYPPPPTKKGGPLGTYPYSSFWNFWDSSNHHVFK